MTAPPDQRIREAAMHDLETSFFLQAGAGTGKTSVLVGRLVEVVRQGRAELDAIAAITFTEKAAGELRDRVRRTLYEALAGAVGEEALRLRAAIGQVDAAHIETIHAFASGLLRERPLEAALDPGFSVLDAVSEQIAFDEEWMDWLWAEEEGSARPRIERCMRLGLTLPQLRDLTYRIAEYRDLDPRERATPPPPASTALESLLGEARALQTVAQSISDAVQREASALFGQLEALQALQVEALEAALTRLTLPSGSTGRGKGEARIQFRDALETLRERQTSYAEEVRAQALAEFIEVAYTFAVQAATRRRLRGSLTFQDLLIEARDLLLHDERARRYFRNRYSCLFVDEFQDTDPLQAEIVLLLAARNETTDWRAVELQPGKLFLVGDPKQSIYRFRRADIDIYAEVKTIFEREAGKAQVSALETNFRSRPELVGWHNHVFGALIQRPSDFPNAQPNYQRLTPDRAEDGPAVLTLLPNTGTVWKRIGEAREDEASALARMIETLVQTETLPMRIYDRADGVSRPRRPRYRDICLLVRSRTNLEIYTKALDEAEIPYHLDSGRGFFRQQEIRDAAAILTALDDPSDEVAVTAALKAAPYAASDEELLEYARQGGYFRLMADAIPEGYDGPLRAPLTELQTLAQVKASMPLGAFVDRVLRETRLLEIQFTRGSAHRAANLQIIVQRAADFAANGTESLRPFVRWLSTQTRTDLAEAESPVTEVEDDVVRILTIHQAKGLEFPIVVLAKMAAADAPDRSIAVVNRKAGRIDFQIGPRDGRFATPGYAEASERQQAYGRAEERRLLYVAATRARDWLVLPVFFSDRARGYHADLEEALPGWMNPDFETEAPGAITCRAEELMAPRRRTEMPPLPDAERLQVEWEAAHEEALARGKPARVYVAPSRVGHDTVKEAREVQPPDRTEEALEPTGGDGAGSEPGATEAAIASVLDAVDPRTRGTALHEALAFADLHDWAVTRHRAVRLLTERGLRALSDDLLRDLETAFQSELLERARVSEQVERELPLVVMETDRNAEGYVDLAFREAAGWVLVDYKSDRDPSQETLDGYAAQMREYVRMFRATGETVTETYLLLTRTGASVPVALD